MSAVHPFWLRDVKDLYLRYLVVGIAAVPAAALYAFLALNGVEGWWSVGLVMTLGLVSAFIAVTIWQRRINAILLRASLEPQLNGIGLTLQVIPSRTITLAIATSWLFTCVTVTNPRSGLQFSEEGQQVFSPQTVIVVSAV